MKDLQLLTFRDVFQERFDIIIIILMVWENNGLLQNLDRPVGCSTSAAAMRHFLSMTADGSRRRCAPLMSQLIGFVSVSMSFHIAPAAANKVHYSPRRGRMLVGTCSEFEIKLQARKTINDS